MAEYEWDVIVVGLGAMGSAAAYQLAKTGCRVLGLDRFHPPHELGSSHGLTRIIREAYFEHPSYVPLVQRAYALWKELENKSGTRVLVQTGGVMVGPPDGPLVKGALRSAEEHQLRYELLSSSELRRRFPAFEPTAEMVAVWEPRAGVLFPEQAIRTHLELAARHGATVHFNEQVLRWEPVGLGVRVYTSTRHYTSRHLMLAAGPWMQSLLAEPQIPLSVERQVLYWFEPRGDAIAFQPSNCPIYIWEYARQQFFYGFPDLGDGVKVAMHHEGEPAHPDQERRKVSDQEIDSMRQLVRRFLPGADGQLRATSVCLYTNTPDEHFVLDWHPHHPQVLLASPCSGHGFKFSSVIGELAASLLRGQSLSLDLSLFSAKRFIQSQ